VPDFKRRNTMKKDLIVLAFAVLAITGLALSRPAAALTCVRVGNMLFCN
jgi:hypothetical protein